MFQFCKVCHSNAAEGGHAIGGAIGGRWVGLSMVLLALLPSVAPAQQSSSKSGTSSKELMALNGNSSKEVQNRVTGDPSYVIGPTDVLDISVWKEPEVSRTVPVRPDGRISLPLLSDVQAAGLTPTQLAAHITESLKTVSYTHLTLPTICSV